MKNIKVLSLALGISFCLFAILSCSKEDTEEAISNTAPKEQIRYYVKYEISTNAVFSNLERILNIKTDSGIQTISLDGNYSMDWDCIYGPVNNDFNAHLECIIPGKYSSNHCSIHARIYVCREEEPFVIKKEYIGTTPMTLEYNIDF